MSNPKPISLEQLFRYKKPWGVLPYQDAAVMELEDDLRENGYEVAMRRDRPWFKTWSQAGKQPDAGAKPPWFEPARKIVAEFEGCELGAYMCPAGVLTVGYGHTGPDVQLGQRITQQQADDLLVRDLQRFADGIHRLIPASRQYGAAQQAALISWAFNIGLGAVEDSTLRKRINAGESAQIVVREELPKWNKGGGKVLPGLERRRAAEVALFTGTSWVPQQNAPAFTPSAPFSTLITPHIAYGELTLNEERRRFLYQGQCDIARELCTFLEKARAQFGNKPLIITSGHRPKAVNQAVGGAQDSEHLYQPGCGAIDFYIQGVPVKTLQDWCDQHWPYSLGYGAPKGFVHLGLRAGRPRVRWDY